jgi:hypothetical protein
MSMSANTTSLPPQAVLGQLINGYWASFSVIAAAQLGVADALGPEPTHVDVLARNTQSDADALYRLLRALASLGIFAETDVARTFTHTKLSEALRSNVPGSMRGLATMTGLLHGRAWPEIGHAVRTGGTAFNKVFGSEIFDYLPTDEGAASAFDSAMTGYTASTSAAVASAYDFSEVRKLLDVGGGSGALLGAIAARHPHVSGATLDLPHVAARAKEHLARTGAAHCEAIAGDFFASVPEGFDAYTLKMILHDWNDERSIEILANVRKAMPSHGKLLVIDAVLPEGNAPSPGKLFDINMLVMTGGRERTEREFRALFEAARFELVRVVRAGATDIIEGRPV